VTGVTGLIGVIGLVWVMGLMGLVGHAKPFLLSGAVTRRRARH
jgi:hypothetical protein